MTDTKQTPERLIARKDLAANTLRELIDYARANPGKLSYASGGVGTLDHLVEGVREGHASALLAASIFHFGTYTIAAAKARLKAAGIPVRGD